MRVEGDIPIIIPHQREKRMRIEQACRMLLSEKEYILSKIARGNEEWTESVVEAVLEDILEGKIDGMIFSQRENRRYRHSIYQHKMIDLFREARSEIRASFQNIELPDLETIADTAALNAEEMMDKRALSVYIQNVFAEIDRKGISLATQEQFKTIISMRLKDSDFQDIANILHISKGRVSQLFSQMCQLFPEFEKLWKIIAKEHSHNMKAKDRTDSRQRDSALLKSALEILGRDFSKESRAACILIQWYLDPTMSEEERDRKILAEKVSVSEANFTRLRYHIEDAAGGIQINFKTLAVRRNVSAIN